MKIDYQLEPDLSVQDFITVLRRSGLAARRPVDDLPRITAMVRQANVIATARQDGTLIGVARAVTDFAFCCYLSDLAVDTDWQGRGIGQALMRFVRDIAHRDAPNATVRCLLLSAPQAMDYYPKVGLSPLNNAFDFTQL